MIAITKTEFAKLADFIKSNYGIYLKQEKMGLVNNRLRGVLMEEGFTNFTDYLSTF